MKNLLIKIIPIITIFFTCISCEKTDENNYDINKQKLLKPGINNIVTIKYTIDGITNTFTGQNIESTLNWKQISDTDSTETLIGNVIFDISEIPDVYVLKIENNNLALSIENSIYSFEEIVLNQFRDSLSLNIITPNDRLVNFFYYDNGNAIPSFLEGLEEGQIISFKNKSAFPILPILRGTAIIIGIAVNYYCDKAIVKDVENCRLNGKCAKVFPCKAECVECAKPK
ncbi:MAG: hypothetical protein RBS19_09200 [Bacteroidales bacterium]|nr:hypothetical protein [Bacteroidales bacterium]MDY0217119.1 hypothetical protein [Bacteroidales bacterium]